MELIQKQNGSVCVLAPDGILDAQGGEKLLEAIRTRKTGCNEVIIDGVLLFGITGEGLDALVQARTEMDGKGRILLRHINEEILEILELTELIYGFEIEEVM